jgi:hypothetical protein
MDPYRSDGANLHPSGRRRELAAAEARIAELEAQAETRRKVMEAARAVVSTWRESANLYANHQLRLLGEVIHELDMAGEFSLFAQTCKRSDALQAKEGT